MLEQLAISDLSVADVSAPINQTPSQMTKHIHILERAGLLSRHKDGRVHRLHMEHEPLQEIMEWVSRYQKFWNDRLDVLENYLHSISEEK